MVSSVLLRNGLLTLVGNARRDFVYDAFISDPTRSSDEDLARFGLAGLTTSATTNTPAQQVAKSAGVAMLGAPVQSLGATLDGSVSTSMNPVQRASDKMAGIDPGLQSMIQPADEDASPLWRRVDDLKAVDRTVKLPSALTDGSPHLFASLRPSAGRTPRPC